MEQLLVKDWMTPKPITVEPETTLPEAVRLRAARALERMIELGA